MVKVFCTALKNVQRLRAVYAVLALIMCTSVSVCIVHFVGTFVAVD